MTQLHSDISNPDTGAHVVFYKEPIELPFKSKELGYPVFEDRDYVEIMWPGNQLNIVRCEVTDEHKARWPRHWAHYLQMGTESHMGLRVEEWPAVTRSVAKSLKALGFHTVEQIAAASDQNILRMGMACGMAPYAFRDKAKAHLASAGETAEAEKFAQENHELRQRIKDLEDAVARAGITAPNAPRRGRPKKVTNGDSAQDAA